MRGDDTYVNIGPMTVKASVKDLKLKKSLPVVMRKKTEKIIEKAEGLTPKKPSGKITSKAFDLSGSLTALTTKPKGKMTEVSCKVSFVVATFPRKKILGMTHGSASTTSDGTPKDFQEVSVMCAEGAVQGAVDGAVKVIRTKGKA